MATLAQSLSWVRTNSDCRAALAVITGALNDGYSLLPQISTDQGLQAQVKGFLDDANSYANTIYGDVPNNGDDASLYNAGRVGICATESDEALASATDAAGVSRFDFAAAITQAGNEIGTNVKAAANAVGNVAGAAAASPFQGLVAGLTSFLYGARVALIIIGAAGVVYVFHKPIFAKLRTL